MTLADAIGRLGTAARRRASALRTAVGALRRSGDRHGEAERRAAATPPPTATPATTPAPVPVSAPASAPALAASAPRREEPRHIPWSYGQDRVTAMAVDPVTVFAWWELTEDAIARAGGASGGLALRVHDLQAGSWIEQPIDREHRQWFFGAQRPGSALAVELGVRTPEGFVAIARSGRVELPRSEPAPAPDAEWLTVLAPDDLRPAGAGARRRRAHAHAAAARRQAVEVVEAGPPRVETIPLWMMRETPGAHVTRIRELLGSAWFREAWREAFHDGSYRETFRDGWIAVERSFTWEAQLAGEAWHAGPFSHPVHVEAIARQAWQGAPVTWSVDGVVHVVEAPWRVVIRNLGAHGRREVIGRWIAYRSWPASPRIGAARSVAARALRPGASELLLGASEALGGASELWRLGASELWLIGASERLLAGASERMLAGASERILAGGSERMLAGASERMLAGGSERMLAGASERMLAGASERLLAGASERLLAGASERLLAGASERLRAGASERLAPARPTPTAPQQASDALASE